MNNFERKFITNVEGGTAIETPTDQEKINIASKNKSKKLITLPKEEKRFIVDKDGKTKIDTLSTN